MTTKNYQCALVGMHFRPPARQVLERLRLGTRLELRREPDNAYDPWAVEVWVSPAEIELDEGPFPLDLSFAVVLAGAGCDLEELLAQEAIQLGFLGASPKLIEAGQVANRVVAEEMDSGEVVEAKLTVSLSGKPSVLCKVER